MPDANGFVEVMKRAARDEREASKPVEVLFGKVISASPLKISVEQKLELGERQLVLTRNVTDFTTEVSVDWKTDDAQSHNHAISGTKKLTIHNRLAAGEEVLLIRKQGGQNYIVVDRTG